MRDLTGRSLRVVRRDGDLFEPLADELVEVVLGMLDSKSLGRTACCNRRLQQMATEELQDRKQKFTDIIDLDLHCTCEDIDDEEERESHCCAPRSGIAQVSSMLPTALSILSAEMHTDTNISFSLCNFLQDAANWPELRPALAEAGAIEAAVAAMRAQPKDENIQNNAALIIDNMNRGYDNETYCGEFWIDETESNTPWTRRCIAAGALEAAAIALRNHPFDREVQEAGTAVFLTLCADGYAAGSRASSAGAVELIEAAITNHDDSDYLALAAEAAILMIQKSALCAMPAAERRSRFASSRCCFDGHALEPHLKNEAFRAQFLWAGEDTFYCDGCYASIPWGSKNYRCDECDFDLCLECAPCP